MKQTLLAIALLGAFGAATAQSSVTVYGTLDAGLIKKTDTTLAIGKRDNNKLGFKGVEDLGNGLKALFQLEIRYEPDTGTVESNSRPLFQGQSRVGLQGGFGMVRLGRGTTALMDSIDAFEPWNGVPSVAGFKTDLTVAGYSSDPLSPAGNSGNRFSNALFYTTPEMAGFQLNATVGTKEANGGPALTGRGTALAPQYSAGAEASANPFSLSATYKNGPFAALGAYERNAIETKIWAAGGSIMVMPELKLMATYSRQDRDHSAALNPQTKAWVAGANYTMGSGKLLAGYGQKSPDGAVKVKEASLGYEYNLSKRTYVYADVSDKKAATSVKFYSVGVHHNF
ncbi:MAG: porin [Pseudomonadota bacterium]|nr:porin [Pseudomonadota bacterium]